MHGATRWSTRVPTRSPPRVNQGSTRVYQGSTRGSTRGQPGVNQGQPGVNQGQTRGEEGGNRGSPGGNKRENKRLAEGIPDGTEGEDVRSEESTNGLHIQTAYG